MKKILFLITGILILTAQKALCITETMSPELEKSLKTHANEPGVMSIIFALLFVIFLIYITGLIYAKLNIVGVKTVKDQLKNYDLNKAIVLSTTQLGQGKNLHVIELNNKRFLIGVGQNSISLIKELEDIIESPNETPSEKAQEQSSENVEQSEQFEKFDVHKKYL